MMIPANKINIPCLTYALKKYIFVSHGQYRLFYAVTFTVIKSFLLVFGVTLWF